MSFFDTVVEKKSNYVKPAYMTLSFGKHVTRILGKPKRLYIHYLPTQRITLECIGDDCPICKSNKRIMAEYPQDFRNVKGFMARQMRHLMNVLDRTPAIVCPNCGTENKVGMNNKFSPTCSNTQCGALLTGATPSPLNKVKILGISNTNAESLNNLAVSQMDSDGNLKDIHSFDIVWMVSKGQGNKSTVNAIPGNGDVVDESAYTLYDLADATLKLTASEIEDVVSGVSLRDVFLARGKSSKSAEVSKSQMDVESAISDLFGA